MALQMAGPTGADYSTRAYTHIRVSTVGTRIVYGLKLWHQTAAHCIIVQQVKSSKELLMISQHNVASLATVIGEAQQAKTGQKEGNLLLAPTCAGQACLQTQPLIEG
jgi:hypothetical protein